MDEDRHSPDQETQLKRDIARIAPFTDAGRGYETRDPCEFWPGEPDLGYPYATNIEGLPATLVVSITGDPTTTHAGGISLAQTLGSSLLTVEGEHHTIAFAGTNQCVNDIVDAYLVDLTLPPDDAQCVL